MDSSEERTWKFGLTLAALVSVFTVYACGHYGKDILYDGVRPCITAVFDGIDRLLTVLAATVGTAAAPTVIVSSVVIPVTTISISYMFRNAEERPKALIVALGLFLNPLFIDFFRDAINEGHPIQQMLVSACGITTFLVATLLWNKNSKLARVASAVLFLLPTFAIIGYVSVNAHRNWQDFLSQLTLANKVGLGGLIVTGMLGIYLSRFYEAF